MINRIYLPSLTISVTQAGDAPGAVMVFKLLTQATGEPPGEGYGWVMPVFAHNAMRTCVLGAAMAGLAATAASARDTVQFDVLMTVPASCGWATGGQPQSTVNLGDLAKPGTRNLPFALDCNTPFVIRAVSQNGAMKRAGSLPSGAAAFFDDAMAYDVTLTLGLRRANGATDTDERECTSGELFTRAATCEFAGDSVGQGWESDDAVANARDAGLPPSRLSLRWDGQRIGGQTMVAGSYSDVLTVSVEAAL